jgi:hypothetical protein
MSNILVQNIKHTNNTTAMSVASSGLVSITEGSTTTVLQRAICNTWATANQSGTMALSDSINIASFSDEGTGRTDYNFSTSYSAANYSFTTGNTNDNNLTGALTGPSTTRIQLLTNQHDGSAEDAVFQCIHICGDLA